MTTTTTVKSRLTHSTKASSAGPAAPATTSATAQDPITQPLLGGMDAAPPGGMPGMMGGGDPAYGVGHQG